MSSYLVLLILEFFFARLGKLPNGLDSNVTKPTILLTKPSVFYYFANISCYLVSINFIIIIIKKLYFFVI